jgi:hypothetical protein
VLYWYKSANNDAGAAARATAFDAAVAELDRGRALLASLSLPPAHWRRAGIAVSAILFPPSFFPFPPPPILRTSSAQELQ